MAKSKTEAPVKPVARKARAEKLPKYMFARGNMIWINIKEEDGRWHTRPTECRLEQVELARKVLAKAMKAVASGVKVADDQRHPTVASYAREWLKDREERGIASVVDERGRLENHVLPIVGHIRLDEFRPRDARDLVRKLVSIGNECACKTRGGCGKEDCELPRALAPRTIHHIFQALHAVYNSAIVEELVTTANPVVVNPGELPSKVDVDPEWRINATYSVEEVESLIGDPRLAVEHRVMYAIKAMTGMRHGEMAALCWRHIDRTQQPLPRVNITQAWCSRRRVVKRTKTEQVRAVPLHPELDRILTAWRDKHWVETYGRAPGPDDFVVPTRNLTCINAVDAGDMLKRDLVVLGLRLEAGSPNRTYGRDRGGHDLRAWYATRCTEDGAIASIISRTTHAEPKDVKSGYFRPTWAALCTEVAKLRVAAPKGDPLPLITASLQARKRAGLRWKVATPTGFEADETSAPSTVRGVNVVGKRILANPSEHKRPEVAVVRPLHRNVDGLRALKRAINLEDLDLAKAIVERMQAAVR